MIRIGDGAFVPNEEIRQELSKAVRRKHWNEMAAFSRDSEELLELRWIWMRRR